MPCTVTYNMYHICFVPHFPKWLYKLKGFIKIMNILKLMCFLLLIMIISSHFSIILHNKSTYIRIFTRL